MQNTNYFLLVTALTATFLAAAVQSKGATVGAKSAELADLKSAIASARDGDVVTIPAGTASWTSSLVITKGITLQGTTTIEGSSASPAVTDGTVILDDIPRQSQADRSGRQQQGVSQKHVASLAGAKPLPGQAHPASKRISALMVVQLQRNQSLRLTGFTFREGAVREMADHGGIRLTGTSQAVRIDHCHFDGLRQNPNIATAGQVYGVVDHCVLDLKAQGAESFAVWHDGWGGHSFGDGSWADDTYFGSEKFLFIEDCTFNKSRGGGLDCYSGGRYVARRNRFNNLGTQSHGTESTARHRSTRAIELYGNTFNWTQDLVKSGQLRGGTLLEFNNTWTGNSAIQYAKELACYREFWPFHAWGAANGNNRLDLNDPHGLYASGKHTGPNSSSTLVVTGADWAPNQWVGYSVTNTTQTLPNSFHPGSYITANTRDTITFARDSSFGKAMDFNNGDGFEIYKVIAALDQPGRGKGDLLNQKHPAATDSWPHQALEPVYAWGNVYQAKDKKTRQLNLMSKYPTIQENRDFYNQKTPFDGTAGVGVGTLADRPKTCSPGVAYWATDQGEWDSTHDGSDGQLYVCTAPNTWSFYYRPYTYPHPLVSGTPAPALKTAEDRRQTKEAASSSTK